MGQLKTTWAFWRYVFGLAWREAFATFKKGAWILAAALAVLVAAVVFWPGAYDVAARAFATAAVTLLATLLILLWKMVSIPARLHAQSLTRAEHRAMAERLERQYQLGQGLRSNSESGLLQYAAMASTMDRGLQNNVPDNPSNVDLPSWDTQCARWYRETYQILREYDAGEAFMFMSVAPESPRRHFASSRSESTIGKLEARLSKLRLIIARAYERSTERIPPTATADMTL